MGVDLVTEQRMITPQVCLELIEALTARVELLEAKETP